MIWSSQYLHYECHHFVTALNKCFLTQVSSLFLLTSFLPVWEKHSYKCMLFCFLSSLLFELVDQFSLYLRTFQHLTGYFLTMSNNNMASTCIHEAGVVTLAPFSLWS